MASPSPRASEIVTPRMILSKSDRRDFDTRDSSRNVVIGGVLSSGGMNLLTSFNEHERSGTALEFVAIVCRTIFVLLRFSVGRENTGGFYESRFQLIPRGKIRAIE